MTDDDPATADEVITKVAERFSGRILTSVIVIAEYIDDDGQEAIYIHRDMRSPIWKHMGMVEVLREDLRNWINPDAYREIED